MRKQRADICTKQKRSLVNRLRVMYGDNCCYCDMPMRFDNCDNSDDCKSLEHIIDYRNIKQTNRSRNDINNFLLAHRKCNSAVSNNITIQQKLYYMENPDIFIEERLHNEPILINRAKISDRRR